MLVKLWNILESFHKVFRKYLLWIVLIETLNIFQGYVISGVVTLFKPQTPMYLWGLGILGLMLFNEVWMLVDNATNWHIIAKQSYPIYRYLKSKMLGKFFELDMPWHQKRHSGVLVNKVNHGVDKVDDLLNDLSWEFVPTIIQAVLSLIPLAIISIYSVPIMLVASLVFMKLSISAHKKRQPLRKHRHDLYEVEWHDFNEGVRAVRTLRVFGLLKDYWNRFVETLTEIQDTGLSEAKIGIYTYNRSRIRVIYSTRIIVLSVWVWQLYDGTMTIPTLIFVNVLLEKLFNSFWRFARLFERYAEASEGAQRLIDLVEQESLYTYKTEAVPQSGKVGISFQDVCFSYNGRYNQNSGAIHELNLEIKPGQVVALVGPSGSGKSTIATLITGLMRAQHGEILIDGVGIRNWPIEQLLSLFAEVPQGDNVHIFDKTIRYNIMIGNMTATEESVVQAAKLAGIHEFVNGLPEKYETEVGERGIRLSGGQKQRIALARAILADRQVLILDEATSAVDAITEDKIQQLMQTILANRTAVIIAHRLSTIWDIADKIVVLDNGCNVEEGTHDELMQKNGLYAEMVHLQTH